MERPPREPPKRSPPLSTMQAAGAAAQSIVDRLGGQPVLLAIILLNITFLGIAGWLVNNQQTARAALLRTILENCLKGH